MANQPTQGRGAARLRQVTDRAGAQIDGGRDERRPARVLDEVLAAFSTHAQGDWSKSADADGVRGRGTQIDHSPAHERTSIIDPHLDGAAVRIVDDGDVGAEWQCAVGRSHGARIHLLAACGATAAVNRGNARIAERTVGAGGAIEMRARRWARNAGK